MDTIEPSPNPAVEAYILWLRRCEIKLANRATPHIPPDPDKPKRASLRKRLLDQI